MIKAYSSNFCLKCDLVQETCCSNTLVPLTKLDIARIESLGFRLSEVATVHKCADCQDEEDWWKLSAVMIEGKEHRVVVKAKKNGECHFLKKGTGCALGEHRPLVCRIFPFWMNSKGETEYCCNGDYCYLKKNKVPPENGKFLLQETEHTVKSYYTKIKEDFSDKAGHKKIIESLKG